MKRFRLLFLVCLLVTALVFSGCKKTDKDSGNGETKDKKETTKEVTEEPEATEEPTVTEEATEAPKEEPTATEEPVEVPTEEPTEEPTEAPTEEPTEAPTEEPTEEPTETPTQEITEAPEPTDDPSSIDGQDPEQKEYDVPEALEAGLCTVADSVEDDDNKTQAYVECDLLVLSEDAKEKYPQLKDAVATRNEEILNDAQSTLDNYKKSIDEGYALDMGYYSLYDNCDIVRADSYVLSLEDTASSFTGGVHPYTGTAGYTFDVETGKVLKIADICNDVDSLPEKLFYTFAGKYGGIDGASETREEEILSYIKNAVVEDSLSFTMGYEGVTFYFAPYEITTYAEGNVALTIPYTETVMQDDGEMVGLFKKKYSNVPANYMRSVTFSNPIEIMGIDGTNSGFGTLTVTGCQMLDEYTTEGLRFFINGVEVFEDTEIENYYYHEAYYVKVGEKNYIFISTTHSSDDDSNYLYEISDGKVTKCYNEGEYFLALGYLVEYDADIDYNLYTNKTVYDPEKIRCGQRHDVIGTNFVMADYRITEEGTIERVSRYYDFATQYELILKKDFKAGMIDPELMFNSDSEATGEFDIEVELTAGDKIYLQKTDGMGQVFFSAENGEWGTFRVDEDTFTLNGEAYEEYFDGLVYAD